MSFSLLEELENKVTVGILFNNEYTDLDNLLSSLYCDVEFIGCVLIISNKANNREKLEAIAERHNEVFPIIIRWYNINTGCAGGRNKLIEYCTSKYLLICDADLIVTCDLVKTLLETAKKYKGAYTIVPKMYFGGTNKLWWGGRYDKHHSAIDGVGLPDTGRFDKLSYGSFVGTCSLLDIDKIKMYNMWFDNEFFIYHEDIYIMEFLDHSIYGIYQPKALAYHNVKLQVTGKYFDIFRNYMTFRNRLITGIKHIDPIGLVMTFIYYVKLTEFPLKLKIRAFLYGVKLGLFKLFNFYKDKIIDSKEYKFVHNFSKNRLILR